MLTIIDQLIRFILLIASILIIVVNAFAQFSGGSGTIEDPYQIATTDQLRNVQSFPNSYFIQTQNIDLNTYPYNTGLGWTPLGIILSSFSGSYDGNEHTISNLFIDRCGDQYIGLFGRIDSGTIRNVILQNVNITGYLESGSLVGYSTKSTIDYCSVSGTLNGYSDVGGVIGYCDSTNVTHCHSTVEVIGSERVGGLIGNNENSSIADSYEEGNVVGSIEYGGLVGKNYNSSITRSYATGNLTEDISGLAVVAGGLIGSNSGMNQINDCYASGNIEGEETLGGLIGLSANGNISRCFALGNVNGISLNIGGFIGDSEADNITDCYSSGAVLGWTNVGGFIGGSNQGLYNNCYAIGHIIGSSIIGGFIGGDANSSTFTNCYWNVETSETSISAGGEGRFTNEMTYPYAENTYVSWDFDTIWHLDDTGMNDGYPYLTSVPVTNDDHIAFSSITLNNYPNPFNPATTIIFELKQGSQTNLSIFNIRGQLVKTILNEKLPVGSHSLQWDGTDNQGKKVSSGLYLCKLVNEGKVQTCKMMLLK
jgi:hypothetical protein